MRARRARKPPERVASLGWAMCRADGKTPPRGFLGGDMAAEGANSLPCDARLDVDYRPAFGTVVDSTCYRFVCAQLGGAMERACGGDAGNP